MTDTADDSITRYHGVQQLLSSPNVFHWWAVDNEVLDAPKLEGLPLGVMDALELVEKRRELTLRENVSALAGKMTVVMVLFFFPALLIFVAGPAFLAIMAALGST